MWLKIALFCVIGATTSLATSFDLGGVLTGNRMAGVPLGRSLSQGELDVEGVCSEPGVACQNCTFAITCVPLPVGYLKVPLEGCTSAQTCNARLGGCSDTPVPECEEASQKYTHTCEQVGIFPDAHNCHKFHLCSPPENSPLERPADHRTALCPRHYGYNPQTAQCSIRLKKNQCSEKYVPTCESVGQSGPLVISPNHYYVCLRRKNSLYPQVFLCPHGWFFWNGFCHPTEEPKVTWVTKEPKVVEVAEASTEKEETKIKAKLDDTSEETPNIKAKSDDTSKLVSEEKSGEESALTKSWIDVFFSTEKATTYAADAFLADKFDLTNYETTDDEAAPSYDFANSFESGNDFW